MPPCFHALRLLSMPLPWPLLEGYSIPLGVSQPPPPPTHTTTTTTGNLHHVWYAHLSLLLPACGSQLSSSSWRARRQRPCTQVPACMHLDIVHVSRGSNRASPRSVLSRSRHKEGRRVRAKQGEGSLMNLHREDPRFAGHAPQAFRDAPCARPMLRYVD